MTEQGRKNEKSRIRLGPGAASLILIIFVLSMAVLGMLALMSARNDRALSRRAAEVVRETYELQERAERKRAELSALLLKIGNENETGNGTETGDRRVTAAERLAGRLPEGVRIEGRLLRWTEEGEGRRLDCALEIPEDSGDEPSGNIRTRWVSQKLTAEIEESEEWDDLWN